MKSLEFTIYMEPVAKGRPRVTRGGIAYTPAKTRNAEADIKTQILARSWLFEGNTFAEGVPLHLEATFYRSRPKSLPKRVVLPVQKPDTTNLSKTLEDAMSGLLYPNDSQLTRVDCRKRFGYPPRIEVKLSLDEDGEVVQ